jgi:hypothetical protein
MPTPHVYNVVDYGAVPDYNPVTKTGTDNLPFFRAALAAITANANTTNGNRSAILVADGHFYLSDTLTLTQMVILEGTGMNEPPPFYPQRSAPGTMLVFDNNVTGIRIYSSDTQDNPTGGADKTVLRNLTIWCHREKEGEIGLPTSHGVHATVTFYAENVTIQNFAGNGFHVTGHLANDEDGNADGTVLRNCVVGGCSDGFHFEGGTQGGSGDAQTCVIDGCNASGNDNVGFFDATFGNTYIGCHSAYNKGPNYKTKLDSNASVFINCWSEEGGPKRNEFKGAVTIISGKIGGNLQYMTPDSTAFILEHGVATRAPIVYKNFGVLKDGTRARAIGCSLGSMTQTIQPSDLNMIALEWAILKSAEDPNIDDSMCLRFLGTPYVSTSDFRYGWWGLESNNSLYRHILRFPTKYTNVRLPAPWFPNGIFIGEDSASPTISFITGKTPPDLQNDGATPRTYEQGDIVWNSEPSAGRPLGWVCTTSGTQKIANPATFVPFGTIHTRGEDAGQLSMNMGGGDKVLTDEEVYSATIIHVSNVGAGTTLKFPAPTGDEDSYQRTIRVQDGGNDLNVDVVGGAAPVTIAATKTAIVGFDANGAYRITADA